MSLTLRWILCAAVSLLAGIMSAPTSLAASSTQPTPLKGFRIHAGPPSATQSLPRLIGADARLQLLVTAELPNGQLRDDTRSVTYEAKPADLVRVNKSGEVTPLKDGHVTITATRDLSTASIQLTIEQAQKSLPINFANQIVPIFTKTGCNTGGCHGKSSGQNGFRLSLMGFEPAEDFEHLVSESRGRRVSPAAPEHSLLLTKATALVPHGGGQRLDPSSDDYKLLVRWISQGMPYGNPTDPSLAGIDVFPRQRTMFLGGWLQLG